MRHRFFGREMLYGGLLFRLPTERDEIGDDGTCIFAVIGKRHGYRWPRIVNVRERESGVHRNHLDAVVFFIRPRFPERFRHWTFLGRTAMIEAVQLIEPPDQRFVPIDFPGKLTRKQFRHLTSPLRHINVRVSSICDECIGAFRHLNRDIRMEVEGCHNRYVGPDHRSDLRKQRAFGVIVSFGDHRTVQRDQDGIERAVIL